MKRITLLLPLLPLAFAGAALACEYTIDDSSAKLDATPVPQAVVKQASAPLKVQKKVATLPGAPGRTTSAVACTGAGCNATTQKVATANPAR